MIVESEKKNMKVQPSKEAILVVDINISRGVWAAPYTQNNERNSLRWIYIVKTHE